jgi:3-deoxy-manno-octulosonate cytidylyltransferase (CMP-KDO synthetase)
MFGVRFSPTQGGVNMSNISVNQAARKSVAGPHAQFGQSSDTATRTATSYIVIPARLASTRLPRKLLLAETGKPLLQHTYEAAQQAVRPSGVCVAADCNEIASVVDAFGGVAYLTSPNCASGTDRIAEVAQLLGDYDILVNVQGDEPELSGAAIDLVVELLEQNPSASMATLATPIRDKEKLHDPACVKVVVAPYGDSLRALYFSRAAIPHAREWDDKLLTDNPPRFLQHLGLYAYRSDFLTRLAKLPRTPLEKLENLEQLRVLESGHEILVGIVDEPTIGIDTPADYAAFVARWRARKT